MINSMKLLNCFVDENHFDEPPTKRKKTVTWADGNSSKEVGDELINNDNSTGNKKVIDSISTKISGSFSDEGYELFSDAIFDDVAKIDSFDWIPAETSSDQPGTDTELAEQRLKLCDELIQLYQKEYWAIADELLLRHLRTINGADQSGLAPSADFNAAPDASKALNEDGMIGLWNKIESQVESEILKDRTPPPELLGKRVEQIPICTNVKEWIDTLQRRVIKSRENFAQNLPRLGLLEASSRSMSNHLLDANGALAIIWGRTGRYLIRTTAFTIGRGTPPEADGSPTDNKFQDSKEKIDIDLSLEIEAKARSISRLQAKVCLGKDGEFWLKCIGKRKMLVNGKVITENESVVLPALSFVQAGPATLLFTVNKNAVNRIIKRSKNLDVL